MIALNVIAEFRNRRRRLTARPGDDCFSNMPAVQYTTARQLWNRKRPLARILLVRLFRRGP